jgi:hypothetical protein
MIKMPSNIMNEFLEAGFHFQKQLFFVVLVNREVGAFT